MSDAHCAAPRPAFRLIASRFPPIGSFDTVSTVADLAAVMELVGLTNDRLVADRLDRLNRTEWVFGVANASVVMASFLHVAPLGARFSGSDLGAWYAAGALATAAIEVAHHLRREAVARRRPRARREFRACSAVLAGSFLDMRGQDATRSGLCSPTSYAQGQALGETIRAAGGSGIVYDSVRHAGGTNVVAYRPRQVTAVTQAGHFSITVRADAAQIEMRRLSGVDQGVTGG